MLHHSRSWKPSHRSANLSLSFIKETALCQPVLQIIVLLILFIYLSIHLFIYLFGSLFIQGHLTYHTRSLMSWIKTREKREEYFDCCLTEARWWLSYFVGSNNNQTKNGRQALTLQHSWPSMRQTLSKPPDQVLDRNIKNWLLRERNSVLNTPG